jgi:hypothetical protein
VNIYISHNWNYSDISKENLQIPRPLGRGASFIGKKGDDFSLIFYNIEPDFTHNIGILLKELEKVTDIPENVRETIELTTYAVQTRYPGEYDEITKEEYEKSIKTAKNCLDWVENKIKNKIYLKVELRITGLFTLRAPKRPRGSIRLGRLRLPRLIPPTFCRPRAGKTPSTAGTSCAIVAWCDICHRH